jgi:bisphosphoglycerate-dependent phosphoglycerate mutase
LVFRHAETFENSHGVFLDWRDSELALKGLSQAQEIAEQLNPFRIDFAFTSHLKRARKLLKSHFKIIHPFQFSLTTDSLNVATVCSKAEIKEK